MHISPIFILIIILSCSSKDPVDQSNSIVTINKIEGEVLTTFVPTDFHYLEPIGYVLINLINTSNDTSFVFQTELWDEKNNHFGKYYLYFRVEDKLDSILLEKGSGKNLKNIIKLAPEEQIEILLHLDPLTVNDKFKSLNLQVMNQGEFIIKNSEMIKFFPNNKMIIEETKSKYEEPVIITMDTNDR